MPGTFSNIWKKIYHRPRRYFKYRKLYNQRIAEIDALNFKTNDFEKTILIVRTDDIGDYILFRNCLEFLSQCKKYKEYKKVLFVNKVVAPLAEALDHEFVDDIIEFDKKSWNDQGYRLQVYKQLNLLRPEYLIISAYRRDFFLEDLIAQAVAAKYKLAWISRPGNHYRWMKSIEDKSFNLFVENTGLSLHEYERNKLLFEMLCEEKMKLSSPSIEVAKLNDSHSFAFPYMVLFPGAGAKQKQWAKENFKVLLQNILKDFPELHVVLAGSKADEAMCEFISKGINDSRIHLLAGKTTLIELCEILAKAKLLIANDTGAAHIGVSLKTPTIIISNGVAYKRYFPHPFEAPQYVVYPKEVDSKIMKNIMPYDFENKYDINKILISKVWEVVYNVLKEK